jgi:hypothetical protein
MPLKSIPLGCALEAFAAKLQRAAGLRKHAQRNGPFRDLPESPSFLDAKTQITSW